MSTSKSQATICLPAHILDAHISPRAREVLMLLASQTTADNPTLWVCHAAIAERLRCSAVTVKRAIQKLVEAKLIVETGDLHERRYKFYRVRWSLKDENAVKPQAKRKNVVTPAKAEVHKSNTKDWMPARRLQAASQNAPSAGMTKKELKPTEHAPPSHPGIDHAAMLKDSRIAYWAEVARKKHEENLKRYRMEQLMLQQSEFASHDPDPVFPNQ